MKPSNNQVKPKAKGQRPCCLDCTKELEPQFVETAMPAQLLDGRRRAEREAWEKEHPRQFTGDYGRFRDNCFCGVTCGYNWAIKRTCKIKIKRIVRKTRKRATK